MIDHFRTLAFAGTLILTALVSLACTDNKPAPGGSINPPVEQLSLDAFVGEYWEAKNEGGCCHHVIVRPDLSGTITKLQFHEGKADHDFAQFHLVERAGQAFVLVDSADETSFYHPGEYRAISAHGGKTLYLQSWVNSEKLLEFTRRVLTNLTGTGPSDGSSVISVQP